jgi:hypothetical protein
MYGNTMKKNRLGFSTHPFLSFALLLFDIFGFGYIAHIALQQQNFGGSGGGFPVTTAVTVNSGGSITTTGTGAIAATSTPLLSDAVVSSGLIGQYQINPSDTVATLKDYSPSANNATGTVGTAPTIIALSGGLSCTGNGGVILPAALNSALTIQVYVGYQSNSNANVNNAMVAGNGNGTVNNAIQFLLNTAGGPGVMGQFPNPEPSAPRLQTTTGNAVKQTGLSAFNGNDVLSLAMASPNDLLYIGTKTYAVGTTGSSAGLQTVGAYQLCGAAAGSGNTLQTYFTGNLYYALFYNRVLSASEISQNVNFMRAQMSARGVQTFDYSTSTKNIAVILGDSIAVTSGLSSSWPAQMALYDNFDISNQSVSGTLICGQIPQADLWVDTMYRPNATRNVVILATGSNDIANVGPDFLGTLKCTRQFVQARLAVGWKVFVTTMLDRNAVSVQKNTWNQILRQYAWTFGPTANIGLIDFAAQVNLGCDACNANGTYFQDGIHPTQTGINLMAPIASFAVNRMFGDSVNSGSPNTAKNQTAGQFIQEVDCNQPGGSSLTSFNLTFPKANLPGDVLVLIGRANSGSITSVTDSNGNSWSAIANPAGGGLFYAKNIVGGEPNAVTINLSPANVCQFVVAEYGGVTNAVPDASANTTGTSTSLSSGNFTTTAANDLVIGGGFNSTSNAQVYTAGGGATIRAGSGGNAFLEDVIFAGPGATSATATTAGSISWSMFGTSFKTQTTTSYAETASDQYLWCDPSGGNETINLPDAQGLTGLIFIIKNIQTSGANTCTVAATGGQLIDGAASVIVANKATLMIQSQVISPSAAGAKWIQLQNN